VKWLVAAVPLCLWGCAGTETGNPSYTGTLGYDAYSSSPARVALRITGDPGAASIEVSSAWLVLGDVSFLAEGECDGRDTLGHAKGLGAGDHVGTQAPATRFELLRSQLCGLQLPFQEKAEIPDSAPAELAGHSILITGVRGREQFRIASGANMNVTLRADAPVIELEHTDAGLVIGFDVAQWLESFDWTGVLPADNGELVIDDEQNPEKLAEFEAHVARGVALFRDRRGDGLLDEGDTPIAHAEE
jgi:hypothetical protein